jgi:hypothetical protein
MLKTKFKKYKIAAAPALVLFLLIVCSTTGVALEYWGYDTGKYATQYTHNSSNTTDDAVLGYQTRVLFSREDSNDNWRLSELKFGLIFSLNPDSPDKSENYWFVIQHWTYYIDWIKFEVKVERYIRDPATKTYIIEPLGGNTVMLEGCGVSEEGDTSDELLMTLYEFIAEQLAGVVHAFFGLLLDTVFTVVDYVTPSGDAIDTGTTSNSDWAAYKENPSDKVYNMGIVVWFRALKNIPKSTNIYIRHRITIYYTIQVKKMGYGSSLWLPMYPIGPLPAYSISRSTYFYI